MLAPRLPGPAARPLRPRASASEGALATRAERRADVRPPDARASDATSELASSSPASGSARPRPPSRLLLDQAATPLLDAVLLRGSRTPAEAPFHVPGHKRGAGIAKRRSKSGRHHPLARLLGGDGGENDLVLLRHDLTELPGLDLLSQPEGAILEAQRLAARAWGVAETRFLVNGSTGGIAAAVLACCRLWARRPRFLREREAVSVGGGGGEEGSDDDEDNDDDTLRLSRPLVLISRGAHRSAAAAAELAGADVVWVEEEDLIFSDPSPASPRSHFESRWGSEGLGRVTTAEGIQRALELARELDVERSRGRKEKKNRSKRARVPAAVLVVSPSYFGACSDIPALAAACRVEDGTDISLIVDQAHGAHFGLDGRFPPCAAAAAAAAEGPTAPVLAVASAHKTLDALGQSALLHSNAGVSEELQREVDRALAALQTSSPSYLLLASLDAARAAAAVTVGGGGGGEEGTSLSLSPWDEPLRAAAAAAEAVRSVPGAHLLSDDYEAMKVGGAAERKWDPLRLTVTLEGVGGRALAAALEERGGDDDDEDNYETAVVEMATSRAVVLALGAGSTVEHAEAFGRALGRVARGRSAKAGEGGGGGESASTAPLPFSPPLGSPSFSSSRETELIPLRASPGRRLAAALLAPYPPGVPLVLEGEPLTPAAVAAAAEAWAAGSAVVGLSSSCSSEQELRESDSRRRGDPFVRVFSLD